MHPELDRIERDAHRALRDHDDNLRGPDPADAMDHACPDHLGLCTDLDPTVLDF